MSGKKKKKKGVFGWILLNWFLFVAMMGVWIYNRYKNGDTEPEYYFLGVAMFFALVALVLIPFDMKSNPLPKPAPPAPKPQIVRTKLMAVNGVNGTYRTGTVSGALVGGMLGGGLGALIGAAANTTDRQYNVDNKYTFLVIYDNGTQKLETVSENHEQKRFELLVSKLDTES